MTSILISISNIHIFTHAERARRKDAETEGERMQKEADAEEQRKKDIELKAWLQKRREERAEQRRASEEQGVLDNIAEAEYRAKVAADERKAAAKKAEEEAAKKKEKAAKAKK